MTPAVNFLHKHKIPHQLHSFVHDPANANFALEAAYSLSLDPNSVFKTLVCESDDGKCVVAILPASSKLNMKKLAKVAAVKRMQMADPAKVEKISGYVLGGVSPFAQKKPLPTFLDESAQNFSHIFVSGGKRGLEIEISPQVLLDALPMRKAICDLTLVS